MSRARVARARAAALLTVLALLAASCGGGGEGDGEGRVTLRFLSLAWQRESVEATRELVDEWNRTHPGVRVQYVQGSWNTVHDQLLTSFEGGEAPDIVHDAADDLADFAYGGHLADLTGLLPERLRREIPEESWRTVRFGDGIHGVPFLQEPRVVMANRTLLERAGVPLPTVRDPWTWEEFAAAAKRLTGPGVHGVAWPLKEPVSATLNLSLGTGGRVFHRGADGKVRIRFGAADARVPALVRRQMNDDRSAARETLLMSGSDTLPGFFAGKYAMVPLGLSYRQQIAQQAPEGFDWVVLPAPRGPAGPGTTGQEQGASPQTLSVAADSDHPREAVAFLDFLLAPDNMVRLAKGDWMLPTGRTALADPSLNTAEHGWRTGTALAPHLRPAPALAVRGYPEWKDKIATPAFQEYYSGGTDLDGLRRALVRDGNRVLARYQR
ncbi:sugar ABC transporter substrate-binding protein [Streptomyces capparidis]